MFLLRVLPVYYLILLCLKKLLPINPTIWPTFWFDKKSDFLENRISLLWLEREKLIPINPTTWPAFCFIRNPIF
ncbi:MAG: hypothetical protein DRR08_07175 [Candidatus Parabeggiatoa sp. nov. 2]|nr:MAG: hypothetical protein B6247_09220 [Beggiatoa sp. 4572_84]RKZ62007.1 MAG: hypothetical protein DRR08_07175 [Gammaproteobacteria bacterium]